LALKVLLAGGLAPHQAQPIARSVALTEASGAPSHGLYRIKGYVASVRSGRVNGAAQPQLHRVASGVVRVDGQNGFAPAAHALGAPVLIEAAKAHGIAALALTHCYHFSSLWHDLTPLVDAGLTCWAFTIGQCIVAPHGGKERLMGTNPIAFGRPRGEQDPCVFDLARGEIELMGRRGEALPEGWGIDAQGKPTRDPLEALAGALLPFGGHKGSALSMMVELLAGPLIGEPTSRAAARLDNGDGGPPLGGELLLAIDPAVFGLGIGHQWLEQAEVFLAEARKQPGVRLPSDRRHAALARSQRFGVDIDQSLLDELAALAA
jgi:LDH2 family malate/lactate/ureidoglycolate dehydrogenase